MKQFIGAYLAIGVLFSIIFNFFGEHSYKGYAANLGKGLVWPLAIFTSYPEISNENDAEFATSFNQLGKHHTYSGDHHRFYESLGYISFYFYAKHNDSVQLSDYRELASKPKEVMKMYEKLATQKRLQQDLRDYLDGMTFGDVIEEKEDIQDDIVDLLEDREG